MHALAFKSRRIIVFVGYGKTKQELQKVVNRLRRVRMNGRKEFQSAYVTQVTARKK